MIRSRLVLLALSAGLAAVATSGESGNSQHRVRSCLSRDDLQYFPDGPEFKLIRQVEAIEDYSLQQIEPAENPVSALEI